MEHWREMGNWPLRHNTFKFLYPDFVKFLTYLWHGDKMKYEIWSKHEYNAPFLQLPFNIFWCNLDGGDCSVTGYCFSKSTLRRFSQNVSETLGLAFDRYDRNKLTRFYLA